MVTCDFGLTTANPDPLSHLDAETKTPATPTEGSGQLGPEPLPGSYGRACAGPAPAHEGWGVVTSHLNRGGGLSLGGNQHRALSPPYGVRVPPAASRRGQELSLLRASGAPVGPSPSWGISGAGQIPPRVLRLLHPHPPPHAPRTCTYLVPASISKR